MPRARVIRSSKPFFSIIVTSKNDAQMLENLCKQLEQQTFQDFELIIVPAAVPDYNVAVRYADKVIPMFSNTKERDMYEVPKVYNKMIKETNGEYIIFIDDDLKFKDDQQLERIANIIKNTRYSIYSCNILQYYPHGIDSIFGKLNMIRRSIYPTLLQIHIFRRDFIDREFLNQDLWPYVWIWDERLTYKLIARGYNVHYIKETLYHLRKYNNNLYQSIVGIFK